MDDNTNKECKSLLVKPIERLRPAAALISNSQAVLCSDRISVRSVKEEGPRQQQGDSGRGLTIRWMRAREACFESLLRVFGAGRVNSGVKRVEENESKPMLGMVRGESAKQA